MINLEELVERALSQDKRSIGKLISIFEDTRMEALRWRKSILLHLKERTKERKKQAVFVGITGTPGSGKSSLLGALATSFLEQQKDLRVAILAVDPSSHLSGGALLGDRTRVRVARGQSRLFFRSQSSDRELGGVSRHTFQVCRLLYFLFDLVLIETVGIGQNEIEIQHVSDRVYLLLQPLAGDQIQFLKAGIMEIPDAFVLNKCDQKQAAMQSYLALRSSLNLARPLTKVRIPIFRTSAKSGEGVKELASSILEFKDSFWAEPIRQKEHFYFEKWIREEFGRLGLRFFRKEHSDTALFLEEYGSFEDAQIVFSEQFIKFSVENYLAKTQELEAL